MHAGSPRLSGGGLSYAQRDRSAAVAEDSGQPALLSGGLQHRGVEELSGYGLAVPEQRRIDHRITYDVP